MDLYNYHRRKSSIVEIGDTPMGGNNPIRIQSMTNTSTLDTEKVSLNASLLSMPEPTMYALRLKADVKLKTWPTSVLA